MGARNGLEGRLMYGADSKARLTNANCTAPQKHVAVASSSLDQPSSAQPDKGMNGLDLSAVERAMIVCFFVTIQ